jgi:hypothetical protein
MRYRYELMFVAVAALLIAAAPATAQTPAPNAPAGATSTAPSSAKKALVDTASALGMVRGVNHALDIVNMFEYTASGTVAGAGGGQDKVTRITVGYDYVIPAIRRDLEATTPDGKVKREIEVAAGPYAWDESTPGIFLRVAKTAAAERLRQIWVFPHALVLAGAKAPDKVRVEERNGVKELIVPGPDGTEIRGILDSKNLPTHVEWKIGGQTFSGDYADYKDFQEYGVMFPVRIVQKIDGREIANLTVSDSLANPYLIFPPPKEVKPSP